MVDVECKTCKHSSLDGDQNPCCGCTEYSKWEPQTMMKPTVREIEEYMAFLFTPEEVSTKGLKYDSGKLNWSLMPFGALQEVVKVLEFGSQKYAPNNWQYVDNADERYWNAAMRHLIAYKTESETDSETGLSHLAHAICCMLFLQHLNNENDNK